MHAPPATAVQRTLLLIADIAVYTRFVKVRASSLAHANDRVSRRVETVIDAARPELRLAKLEGDAVEKQRLEQGERAVGRAARARVPGHANRSMRQRQVRRGPG